MLTTYFTIAWRNLLKNKTASIINICGLALGLATGIIIMLEIREEYSYDTFHKNLAGIFILMKNQQEEGETSTNRAVPGPLAASLRDEMPEMKYVARVSAPDLQVMKVGDKTVYESGFYADPDFFTIMQFSALQGNPVNALREPGSVVITERTAKKLFGKEDPIGKIFVHNSVHALKVSAVIRDVPSNSSKHFDIVLPFSLFEQENQWLKKWDDNRIETWVQLEPGVNVGAVNAKMTRLFQERSNDSSVTMFAYPLANLRLYGQFTNGKPSGGRIYMVVLLSIVGLFVLLIACINFMNLATARSEHRAREVGVRKVLGASRKMIIFQFFSEALLMTFLALLLGVLSAKLILPAFNRFTQQDIIFNFGDWQIISMLLGIGLFTGVVAGSYPALFLSRFETVKVLKGVIASSIGGGSLRRAMVTFQFVISIFFMIGTIVIMTQINHVRNRPLGYDQENLIDIPARGDIANHFDIFKNELTHLRGIKNITAGTDNVLQFNSGINGMDWPGKMPGRDFMLTVTWVHYNWTATAGLKIAAGRDFNSSFGTDTAACLINQTAVKRMGLKNPLGAKVGDHTVIGVLQDFVFNNASGEIAPMVVFLSKGAFSHFLVRIENNEQWRQTIAQIEKTMKRINPNFPFEFSFTKEAYQKRFEEFSSFGLLATLFGCMAIFISCLGLFGLSSFLAERRGREMSIRKVLGASVRSVWFALSKDFLKPVFIACVLAIPLSVWAMQALLSSMAYRIQLSWWMFALAGVLAVVIAIFTISFEALKTAVANPIKRLRSE